jgi:predicted RND superfamily exporter protein
MKINIVSLFVTLLLFFVLPFGVTFAQSESTTEESINNGTVTENSTSTISSDVTDSDSVLIDEEVVVGVDESGDLTLGEYNEIIQDAEELSDEVLNDLESVSGEIIAINEEDGTVVLETPDGDLLTVDMEVVIGGTRLGGGGKLLNPKLGDSFVVAADGVDVSTAEIQVEEKKSGPNNVLIFITTNEGKKQLATQNVPVYKNGERIELSSLNAKDSIQVAQNADGEVVAIYASSTDEEMTEGVMSDDQNSSRTWVWIIGLLLVAGILYFTLRKKEETEEV